MKKGWFKQVVQVTLETQFPVEEDFADRLRERLGPWCAESKVVTINEYCA